MDQFFSLISENLIVPVIALIGASLVLIIKRFLDKVNNSIVTRDEINSLEKRMRTRRQLISIIDDEVKAAVAANMQLADQMKYETGKLSDEQIEILRESSSKAVMDALPASLTDEGGVLLELIGGQECLERTIRNVTEKYVYEYNRDKTKCDNSIKPVDKDGV